MGFKSTPDIELGCGVLIGSGSTSHRQWVRSPKLLQAFRPTEPG